MENTKQVKNDFSDTLRLSFYIQLQVITIEIDWLHYLVRIWFTCLVVWFVIFMAEFVLRYLEVEENYQ